MWSRLICKLFHKQDHVCWDKLWSDEYDGKPVGPIPGNWCWVCNRCKRTWHTPNPHVFPSELPERQPWAEYRWPERWFIAYDLWPKCVVEILEKRRKERDAKF